MSEGEETVLLVDEDELVRRSLAKVLGYAGYRVIAAGSVDAALAAADDPAIEVLLTDVVLPGTSGFALAESLTTRRPGLRVVYMSGFIDHPRIREGLAAGTIDFLAKPFTSAVLLAKLREVLDR